MSDTINVLNQILRRCAEREQAGVNPEDEADHRLKLLELIAEDAGDCLEEHTAARLRAKPRKQRVYKQILEEIAMYFCDGCDTAEGSYHTEEAIRNILIKYNITTRDIEGKVVKIS